ncbi:MAG: BtpA/SgcQ family protein [Caldilineaceae bacterium]|nr:BtpA/SgcQ family protein [Caldilineaceae bacterium]
MKIGILPEKPNTLQDLFGVKKPIIGMIHLLALPGAPHFKGGSLEPVLEFALRDVQALRDGGVDGLIVENAWDLPFSKDSDIGLETVAAMSALAGPIRQEAGLPVGINCLANGAIPGLAIAKASGAQFVRVNQWVNAYVANEGIIEGPAGKALRYRSFIKGDDIKIFADVHVKHGAHAIVADRTIQEQTRDAVFFDADVLIATGQRTGDMTEVSEIDGIRRGTTLPIIIGSGFRAEDAQALLRHADGAIVGSSIKQDGVWWNPVDQGRVRQLMDIVGELREETA